MSPTIPTTQLAVQATKYGNPAEAVHINTSAPVSTPKENEILIHVKATSVNPVDVHILAGYYQELMPMPLPYVIGSDASGVVVAVGSAVKRLKVGDEVYTITFAPNGGWQEYLCIPEQQVSLKPKSLSHIEAAALPVITLTSYQGLVRYGKLQKGQKVIVLGGSGGTGIAAIQIAKALGASEIAVTASSKNADFVKSLGATKAIAYDRQQWWEELAGADYDLLFDTVGDKDSYDHSQKVLKQGATFVSIADKGLHAKREVTSPKYHSLWCDATSEQGQKETDEITKLVEAGHIKPIIQQQYEVKDVVQALETSASGRVRGKLVIDFNADKHKQ